jgi:predicted thioesterase
MAELQTGIRNRAETVSSEERSALSIGSGNVRVFATVSMIGLMEKTCLDSVLPFLEPGQDTVGIHVNVSHCSATPVGMKVWCESELVEIDRRRLVFKVAAYDESGLIGEGTHERFIIDKDRFESKAASKL